MSIRFITSLIATLSTLAVAAQAADVHSTASREVSEIQPELVFEEIASGFSNPIQVTNDRTSKLFVVEQAGRIRIIEDRTVLPEPFLDIASRVRSGGERGLLGLAFHPSYSSNQRFFCLLHQ